MFQTSGDQGEVPLLSSSLPASTSGISILNIVLLENDITPPCRNHLLGMTGAHSYSWLQSCCCCYCFCHCCCYCCCCCWCCCWCSWWCRWRWVWRRGMQKHWSRSEEDIQHLPICLPRENYWSLWWKSSLKKKRSWMPEAKTPIGGVWAWLRSKPSCVVGPAPVSTVSTVDSQVKKKLTVI